MKSIATLQAPLRYTLIAAAVTAALAGVAAADGGPSDRDGHFHQRRFFFPDNLVVSRSVYDNNAKNVVVGTVLPPDCPAASGACGAASGAPNDGSYPNVWNNDIYDPSFGITSRIFLDQMTPFGWVINTLAVPDQPVRHGSSADHLVTSFSSKSELALNLSNDGRFLTFMGYVAPINAIDVSNSNTPAAVDPTNPVGIENLRAVAQVDAQGRFQFTETNAYSGNNGRAAIQDDSRGVDLIYTVGNAGNGANPQPNGIILGAGAQIMTPASASQSAQAPGVPTPVASFSVTELGAKADKIGKDDNYRGLTIFNNVLFFTKGSGSNGVNTVYFVDTTGSACPKGVGLPVPGALLPTAPLAYSAANLQSTGLPDNVCILAGFPQTPNKSVTATAFPFGLWFANAHTLYLADEGDGYTGGADLFAHAAAQTTAGLQKWVLNDSTGRWALAYTITNGLDLGTAYKIHGYPSGSNPATGLPWAPATDGLRNITGRVGRDGVATIWAITSTISGNGDVGADPNRLVAVRDSVESLDLAAAGRARFITLRTADFAEVLRGVSLTPGSDVR
ncbi:MAG TPA: hypothetical protein VGI90_08495 [Steroidobacteraceae bacterium]|jgi:hypothetical protein